ncbi:MAG: hypothetical protein J6C23_02535 [Clostridia bacterium]|nr:hypothetical protein [Clostridia bacterium]
MKREEGREKDEIIKRRVKRGGYIISEEGRGKRKGRNYKEKREERKEKGRGKREKKRTRFVITSFFDYSKKRPFISCPKIHVS